MPRLSVTTPLPAIHQTPPPPTNHTHSPTPVCTYIRTCDPVSMVCRGWPVRVFQNRIVLSAVPPPEARTPCWWGDQVRALMAAEWALCLWRGVAEDWLHTNNCGGRGRGEGGREGGRGEEGGMEGEGEEGGMEGEREGGREEWEVIRKKGD